MCLNHKDDRCILKYNYAKTDRNTKTWDQIRDRIGCDQKVQQCIASVILYCLDEFYIIVENSVSSEKAFIPWLLLSSACYSITEHLRIMPQIKLQCFTQFNMSFPDSENLFSNTESRCRRTFNAENNYSPYCWCQIWQTSQFNHCGQDHPCDFSNTPPPKKKAQIQCINHCTYIPVIVTLLGGCKTWKIYVFDFNWLMQIF